MSLNLDRKDMRDAARSSLPHGQANHNLPAPRRMQRSGETCLGSNMTSPLETFIWFLNQEWVLAAPP